MDDNNLRKNLPKFHFAKIEIEGLGHKFTQSELHHLKLKQQQF